MSANISKKTKDNVFRLEYADSPANTTSKDVIQIYDRCFGRIENAYKESGDIIESSIRGANQMKGLLEDLQRREKK